MLSLRDDGQLDKITGRPAGGGCNSRIGLLANTLDWCVTNGSDF